MSATTPKQQVLTLVGKPRPAEDEIVQATCIARDLTSSAATQAVKDTLSANAYEVLGLVSDNIARASTPLSFRMQDESRLPMGKYSTDSLWVLREFLRLWCRYYNNAPLICEDIPKHSKAVLAMWGVHISRDDPTLWAYTPTHEYGVADRQVKMRPEALIRRVLPAVTDAEVRAYVQGVRAEMDNTFLVASTVEDVMRVYQTMAGDTGCMRHEGAYFSLTNAQHPSMVYAAPERGWGVAYLTDDNGVVKQRCVIYDGDKDKNGTPGDKRMVRIYGSGPLERKLQRAGYDYRPLDGLTLPAINAVMYGEDAPSPNRWLMPYIDPPAGNRGSYEQLYGLLVQDDDGSVGWLLSKHEVSVGAGRNAVETRQTAGRVYFDEEPKRLKDMFPTSAISGKRITGKAEIYVHADGTWGWVGADEFIPAEGRPDMRWYRVFTYSTERNGTHVVVRHHGMSCPHLYKVVRADGALHNWRFIPEGLEGTNLVEVDLFTENDEVVDMLHPPTAASRPKVVADAAHVMPVTYAGRSHKALRTDCSAVVTAIIRDRGSLRPEVEVSFCSGRTPPKTKALPELTNSELFTTTASYRKVRVDTHKVKDYVVRGNFGDPESKEVTIDTTALWETPPAKRLWGVSGWLVTRFSTYDYADYPLRYFTLIGVDLLDGNKAPAVVEALKHSFPAKTLTAEERERYSADEAVMRQRSVSHSYYYSQAPRVKAYRAAADYLRDTFLQDAAQQQEQPQAIAA